MNRFGVVVFALIKFAAATSALRFAVQLRYVIAFAALLANSSAAKTVEKERTINVDVDNEVDVRDLVKRFRLRDRTGETVEKVTILAIFSLQAVLYDFAGNFVRNELTFIGIGFCE